MGLNKQTKKFDFEFICVPQDFTLILSWSHFFHPLSQDDLTQVHGFVYHSFAEKSHFQISCACFSLYSVMQEKYLDIILTPLSPF